jgi:hypothetical protein
VLSLTRHSGAQSASSRHLKAIRAVERTADPSTGVATAPLDSVQGQVYLAEVQLGDAAPKLLVVDTGSSDTWYSEKGLDHIAKSILLTYSRVASERFRCVGPVERTPYVFYASCTLMFV